MKDQNPSKSSNILSILGLFAFSFPFPFQYGNYSKGKGNEYCSFHTGKEKERKGQTNNRYSRFRSKREDSARKPLASNATMAAT
jgi:hypothetical protein